MEHYKSARLLVEEALHEDIGVEDVTSQILEEGKVKAHIFAKKAAIVAGLFCAKIAFKRMDEKIRFLALKEEGEKVEEGEVVAEIFGKARAVLSAERVALNFLCHLSGIATATAQMVEVAKKYGVKILDTRKTTPLMRVLEKYAVRVGGGKNHRFTLHDGILIKENHIKVVGSIKECVRRARERSSHMLKVEVEVKKVEEVDEALEVGADIIMLDGLSLEKMREAIKKIRKEKDVLIEVSGVRKDEVEEVARLCPDFISLGWITHSAPAADFSLKVL